MLEPEKFIKKLPETDARRIREVLAKILREDFSGLYPKKLKGFTDLFRIRVGKYRLIFQRTKDYGIVVVKIGKRDDHTYGNL